ncbi:hypothetical protein BD626DRAFT_483851 [Schizophyllum amplum]|uniref:Uncharacterized protein n=1 Tax=Schizophyllum amplum TaxID=97359 RepID=A0A550CPU7_9AGAR|nr:hypothetical protein BD626DRAFT_483851 [Auriculariopsis ampla]
MSSSEAYTIETMDSGDRLLCSTTALPRFSPSELCSSQARASSSQELPATSSTPPDEDVESRGSFDSSMTSETVESSVDSRSASYASQDSGDSSSLSSDFERSQCNAYANIREAEAEAEHESLNILDRDGNQRSPHDDEFTLALKERLHDLLSANDDDMQDSPQGIDERAVDCHPFDLHAHIPRFITRPVANIPSRFSREVLCDDTPTDRTHRSSVPRDPLYPLATTSRAAHQHSAGVPHAHIPNHRSTRELSGTRITAQESYSPLCTVSSKRRRSDEDTYGTPVPLKRHKSGPHLLGLRAPSKGDKENQTSIPDVLDPLVNALVRRRSRLAAPSSVSAMKTDSRRQDSTTSQYLARVPASLRKAGSLRSNPDSAPPTKEDEEEPIPTEPNTPIPVISPSAIRSPSAQLSRSAISSASARLRRLCQRTRCTRPALGEHSDGDKYSFEDTLVIGADMRLKVVDWLLTFLPSKRAHPNLYDQLVTSPETRFQSIALFLTCLKQTVEENNWAHFVDAKCRARLIVDAGDDNRQLTADEEHCNTEEDVAEYEKEEFMEGLRLIVWDIAVGALALSVKFHRDNLPPLLPIYADEFIDIAPHDVEYQTFEECQRDILRSVSYMFGVTPQPLMDNLWLALPELQTVLDYDGPSGSEDFSKASGLLFRSARAEADIAKRWNCVRRRAWELLIRTCRGS